MSYSPYILEPPEAPDSGCYCVNCDKMIIPDEDTWVWDGEYVCDEDCMREYCRSLRVRIERVNKRIDELVKQITMGTLT